MDLKLFVIDKYQNLSTERKTIIQPLSINPSFLVAFFNISDLISIIILLIMMKNYLGYIDETFIKTRVSEEEKLKYWIRNGEVTINILRVQLKDMKSIFVMSEWDHFAFNSMIHLNALSQPNKKIS